MREAALPMTAEESFPHDRRLVLMCALRTLDPISLDSSIGLRLFLDRLSPGLAAWKRREPPAAAAARINGILWELCAGVRREVLAALKAQSESCRRLGWTGPFVALQVDSTGMARSAAAAAGGNNAGGGDEVCTASVSFVPENFSGFVRLAIGARCFHGGEESHPAKEAWIREVVISVAYVCVHVGFCEKGIETGWEFAERRALVHRWVRTEFVGYWVDHHGGRDEGCVHAVGWRLAD